jgi:NTP-dependent ternary system trypsin peptidase co-occuring protein
MQDESIVAGLGKQMVEVKLDDGTIFYVQAQTLLSESNVSLKPASFEKVTQAIEGVAQRLNTIWKKVEPSKASVEFGIEFTLKAGDIVAVFVDSSTTASMKVTLEWASAQRDE